MQEALESIFGPGVGLLGLLFMFVMIAPKFLRRWRGFHARKHGPVDCRPRLRGCRRIAGDADTELSETEAHPEHGEVIACLQADPKVSVIMGCLWMLPMIVSLVWIPADQYSLRGLAVSIALPMVVIGLATFLHCRDRAIFYRTGFVFYRRFRKTSLDYNMVVSVTERPSLVPLAASSQILRLDDNSFVVLDGIYMRQGFRLKGLFGRLTPRVKSSDAAEKFRESHV